MSDKTVQEKIDQPLAASAPGESQSAAVAARLPENPLSEREMDVAKLLATGVSNNEIAEELVISPHTVKVHLRNIYEKLGVSSRTEASLVLLQQGWMVLPGIEVPVVAPAEEIYPDPEPLADTVGLPFFWQPIYLLAILVLVVVLLFLPTWSGNTLSAPSNLLSDSSDTALGQPAVDVMPRWSSQTPLPAARSRLALVMSEGKRLYALGGERAGGAISASLDMYDLDLNEWIPREPLPLPLSNLGAVAINDQIYVAGGTTPAIDGGQMGETELSVSSTFLRYDTTADTWTIAGDLPAPLAGSSLVATPEALYLLGGWDGEAMHDEVWQLDLPHEEPVTAADWRVVTEMANAHAFGGAVIVDNFLYIAGGYDGQRELDQSQRYNLVDQDWESLPPLSTPRGGMHLLYDGLAIFAVGGGWGKTVSTLERFDPATGLWSHFPSPIAEEWRHLGAAASSVGYLYLIGGWSDTYLSVHLRYQSSFRSFLPATQSNDAGSR